MDHNFLAEKLAQKSLLISGGTGFIGKNILNYFYVNQIKLKKLTIITRNKAKFIDANPQLARLAYINYIEVDICNLTYTGEQYDYIIHAATSVIDKVESTQLLDEIIVGGKQILEFACKAGVKSLINFSSGAVYGGISAKVGVTEDYLGLPNIESKASSYGLGKLMSEHYSYLSASEKMRVTSLRCFCFGGDYLDSQHYALGTFIDKALKNEDIIVQSGSEVYRSYLSTRDMAEWTLFFLINAESNSLPYRVYNVGSDEALTIPQLAFKVVEVLQSNSKIICPNLANKNISYYVPNIDRARALNLTINDNLDDIILHTAKFYQSYLHK